MNDRDYSVYAENRSYLDGLKHEYNVMDDGVAFQFADAIGISDAIIDPIATLELFEKASGDRDNIEPFARVCKYLTIPPQTDTESEDTLLKSVVYFRTPVSDKAYSLFSMEYKGLGAMYAADFKTVCEDVYYDRADACILPLESSEDGLIMSFRHMLLKYELTITSVIAIDIGEDKYQTMALLTNGKVDVNGNVCELCLTAVKPDVLSKFCESLRHFDAAVIRISSVPSKIRGKYDYHICLSVPTYNFPRLRFFTDAVSPASVFLGQYKSRN